MILAFFVFILSLFAVEEERPIIRACQTVKQVEFTGWGDVATLNRMREDIPDDFSGEEADKVMECRRQCYDEVRRIGLSAVNGQRRCNVECCASRGTSIPDLRN